MCAWSEGVELRVSFCFMFLDPGITAILALKHDENVKLLALQTRVGHMNAVKTQNPIWHKIEASRSSQNASWERESLHSEPPCLGCIWSELFETLLGLGSWTMAFFVRISPSQTRLEKCLFSRQRWRKTAKDLRWFLFWLWESWVGLTVRLDLQHVRVSKDEIIMCLLCLKLR